MWEWITKWIFCKAKLKKVCMSALICICDQIGRDHGETADFSISFSFFLFVQYFCHKMNGTKSRNTINLRIIHIFNKQIHGDWTWHFQNLKKQKTITFDLTNNRGPKRSNEWRRHIQIAVGWNPMCRFTTGKSTNEPK